MYPSPLVYDFESRYSVRERLAAGSAKNRGEQMQQFSDDHRDECLPVRLDWDGKEMEPMSGVEPLTY
jgi:hypothetical protein